MKVTIESRGVVATLEDPQKDDATWHDVLETMLIPVLIASGYIIEQNNLEIEYETNAEKTERRVREAIQDYKDNHPDGTVSEEDGCNHRKKEGCCGHDSRTGKVIESVYHDGISSSRED